MARRDSKQYYTFNDSTQKQHQSEASKPIIDPLSPRIGSDLAISIGDANNEYSNAADSCCNKRWCWWGPAKDSLISAYCRDTSIHGLRFMGQQRRHFTERLFWLVAFILSASAAAYLIHDVWTRYTLSPVIVTFQNSELDMDSLPFPAVTICNVNQYSCASNTNSDMQRVILQVVSKVQNRGACEPILISRLEDPLTSATEQNAVIQNLSFVRGMCNAQRSFAEDFGFAYKGGILESLDYDVTVGNGIEMLDFIMENTLSCGEMIRLCRLGKEKKDCSEIFKPVITDLGKCCTFNILSLPLLLKDPLRTPNQTMYDNPLLGKQGKIDWPQSEINEWQQWEYGDHIHIDGHEPKPWRQKRSGMPYGLSILLDPNIDEFYCPAADSYGAKYILHSPMERPHVLDFASAADLDKEMYIEVHPDVTNADDNIRHIEPEQRQCFFGSERNLDFFGPYTGRNCIEECSVKFLAEQCHCVFFYMTRIANITLCNIDPYSLDYECMEEVRVYLQDNLREYCGNCKSLCEDIAYNYETTIVELQNNSVLWNAPTDAKQRPHWWNHRLSILHIFFGTDTTVPKYRKRLYSSSDLIGSTSFTIRNTGGILGLCLGFSVLSAVEVFYFVSIRWFWKSCHNTRIGFRIRDKFKQVFSVGRDRVVSFDPQNMLGGFGQGSLFDGYLR